MLIVVVVLLGRDHGRGPLVPVSLYLHHNLPVLFNTRPFRTDQESSPD